MFSSTEYLEDAPRTPTDFRHDETASEYALNPAIAGALGIVATEDGQVPTHNGRGVQMAGANPLLDVWIERGFDGVYPLLDIGSAYGANTIRALKRGANVVAFDCDETHLEYIRRAWDAERGPWEGALQTVYGKLPELELPAGVRASGILCSEVIHFLTGEEVEQSFRRFREVLTPGGLLCLTCGDASALYLDDVFDEREAAGVRWPGELEQHEFDAFLARVRREMDLPEECMPTYLHMFGAGQIARLAEEAGFRVISCEARMHPGYPEVFRGSKGRPNVQLVAVRR